MSLEMIYIEQHTFVSIVDEGVVTSFLLQTENTSAIIHIRKYGIFQDYLLLA